MALDPTMYDSGTPPAGGAMPNGGAGVEAALGQAQVAGGELQGAVQNFDPESATGPALLPFAQGAPTDHFNAIVGQAPLLVALGALGGVLGRNHGIAMLASTNAMMKGFVTGSAEQYQDARQQYEEKYQQWRDQSRTFLDTYKAYTNAYKGRVDVASRAYQGSLAAVGIQLKLAQANGFTARGAADLEKIQAQIDRMHNQMMNDNIKTIADSIRAHASASRADSAAKDSQTKFLQLQENIRKDGASELVKKHQELQKEYDGLAKAYPMSQGRPPEVAAQMQGLRDRMDLVNEHIDEQKKPSYPQAKAYYDQAQDAIDHDAPLEDTRAQLKAMRLDPNMVHAKKPAPQPGAKPSAGAGPITQQPDPNLAGDLKADMLKHASPADRAMYAGKTQPPAQLNDRPQFEPWTQ